MDEKHIFFFFCELLIEPVHEISNNVAFWHV